MHATVGDRENLPACKSLAEAYGADVKLRRGMAWTKPDYSRRRVDQAGETELLAAVH